MASFEFTRTFHPVGQGAFYSECFETEDRKFIMVYDCGATNSVNPPKSLCKEVRDSFHEDQFDADGRLMIDILFLSHFHNDHVNGVSLLAPKKVVCPLLDDDDILMLQIMDYFQKEWNIQAMRDPGILFTNNPEIIRVEAIGAEEQFEGPADIMSPENLPLRIKSGVRIGVKSSDLDLSDIWYFIPYNFHYRKLFNGFKVKLQGESLSYDELRNDPITFIKEHKSKLRKIFNTFTGNTNDKSLIVYSGPTNSNLQSIYHPDRDHYFPYFLERWKSDRLAAIYYGDITLREELVSSLTKGLSIHMLRVGTIQLPHHGSDRSFHISVLYYFTHQGRAYHHNHSVLFVMCAGSKSKTHPGKNVIMTLSNSGQAYTVVKEHRYTTVIERWSISYSTDQIDTHPHYYEKP